MPDSREEFEAWLRDTHLGYPACINQHAGEYTDPHIRKRWETWQASRAALKVELPEPVAGSMSLVMLSDVRFALQQAGIEVK